MTRDLEYSSMDILDDEVSCCAWLCPFFAGEAASGANEPLLHARVARENSAGELQRLQSLAQDGDENDLSDFLGCGELR